MKLWDKGTGADRMIGEFTAGKDRETDLHLAVWDVVGSIAHIRMLNRINMISDDELSALETELKHIYRKIKDGNFTIAEGVEDVHSQIEFMLTGKLGEAGKKVHTARSRNDQVLVDIKLFARDKLKQVVLAVTSLFDTLISLSDKHREILMPGYTHMQIAMPSSFGLWFGAYAESLAEDMFLLKAAYKMANQNPLGSAAGFGSGFPVDRSLTTELLGFENMHINVINAQMNRGKMEKVIAFALGSVGATLSRLAMDICMYSGQNFRFFILPDEYTTGSSIMPHKKNPDVFELIRARGNKLQALAFEISMVTTNLPSGYHRDFQQIKESFVPSFDMLLEMLKISKTVIEKIKISNDIVENELYQDLFSVEEVNKLVLDGVAFRDAYRQVAEKIADGTYVAKREIDHVHEGSIGNLRNDKIIKKMNEELEGFEFEKAEKAIMKLLE